MSVEGAGSGNDLACRADDGAVDESGGSTGRVENERSKETMTSASRVEGLSKTKESTTETQAGADLEKEFEESPIKTGEKRLDIQDPMIEENLGSGEDRRPTFISAKLSVK